ncbi:hypothetical protein RRG08_004850, partial [Elysia crispata]
DPTHQPLGRRFSHNKWTRKSRHITGLTLAPLQALVFPYFYCPSRGSGRQGSSVLVHRGIASGPGVDQNLESDDAV